MFSTMLLLTICTNGQCEQSILDVWASEDASSYYQDVKDCQRTIQSIARASGLNADAMECYSES